MQDTLPDKTLIERCIKRDSKAWEILIQRYERLIYYAALRAGAADDEVDDIFQSVCMIWLKNLPRLRDPDRLGAWLVTITQREVKTAWKKTSRMERIEQSSIMITNGRVESAESLAAKNDQLLRMKSGIRQLTDRCRELLELMYFGSQQLTYKQISERLGIPLNSIGPTRARCLEKLRDILNVGQG